MKRSSFLKSIATLFFAPSIISKVDNRPCAFNEKAINNQLDFIRKYPLTESECFHPHFLNHGKIKPITFLDQRPINLEIINFK